MLVLTQQAIAQLDSLFWDTLSFANISPHRDEGLAKSKTKGRIIEDTKGNIWVATDNGIFRYDGYEALNFSTYLINKFPEYIGVTEEGIILIDNFGKLWIGNRSGLFVYDFKKDELKTIALGESIPANSSALAVEYLTLIEDHLYVLAKSGLTIIDTKTEKIIDQFFNETNVLNFSQNDASVPNGTTVAHVVNDSILYAHSMAGMRRVNMNTREEVIYKAPFRRPNHHWFYNAIIKKDSIWMSSWGAGLVTFNLKTNQFKDYYLPTPYIPSRKLNIVKNIQSINDSTFLLSLSSAGLGVFDIKNHQFQLIPSVYIPNHFRGVASFTFIDSRGYAWVGRPLEFLRSKVPVRPPTSSEFHLSIARILHHQMELARPSTDLSSSLNLNELTSQQISIILAVSHQDKLKEKLSFRYQLNNKKWVALDEGQTIHLNNLSAGKNSIDIEVRLNEKLLDRTQYNFEVKIPFYKQTWFWILMIAFAALLSYFWYLEKIKRLKKEQAIVLDYEKQLARLETMALRSQMNPHFIFNSINSIKGLIITDKKEEASDQLTRFAKFMRNILNYSDKDLITLADELKFLKAYCRLEQFKNSKFIDYQVHLDTNIDEYEILIPPFLLQPFLENSFKHAFKDSKINDASIELSISQMDRFLKVQICDNGIGTQSNKDTDHVSKGINIVKKRLELRNGMEDNIQVSFNGYLQGTTVDFKIKIDD